MTEKEKTPKDEFREKHSRKEEKREDSDRERERERDKRREKKEEKLNTKDDRQYRVSLLQIYKTLNKIVVS